MAQPQEILKCNTIVINETIKRFIVCFFHFRTLMSNLYETMSSIDPAKLLSINHRLKEISDNSLHSQLTANQNEIIDIFGGLENMICLCLTNPNACDKLDPIKLTSFEKKFITNNTINEDIDESHEIN